MKKLILLFLAITLLAGFAGEVNAQTVTITKYPSYIPAGSSDTLAAPFAIYVVYTGGLPDTILSLKVGDPAHTAIGNQLFTYRNSGANAGTWGKTTSYNTDNFVFRTSNTGTWEGWVPVKSHRTGITQISVRVRYTAGGTTNTSPSVNIAGEVIPGTNSGYLVGNLLDGSSGTKENKIIIGYNGTEIRGIWFSEPNTVNHVPTPVAINERNTNYTNAITFVNSNGGYAMPVPNGSNAITKIEVYSYPNNTGASIAIATELLTASLQNVTIPNSVPTPGNGATVGMASNITLAGNIPDGSGSATLVNDGVGIFSSSTIFPRNSSSQTVKVTITGVTAGLLDQVRLTIPSDFTGFSGGNVTLGGAFAGKSTSIVGNQITVLSAALGTTPGTITISNLTSPNPIGALQNGNSTWSVETAIASGTLTAIATSPKSYTIIPIQNLKTGGTDGFGNSDAGNTPAMSGQTVVVSGIATMEHQVLNTVSYTSFYIQEAGYGLQVFRSGTPVVTWVRGDQLVLRGTVGQFNGGMQISPFTGASPDFFNLGAGVMPTPVVLTNASQLTEQYEGKLIQLNSATFDSAGQSFIASAVNRGMNNFRTAPTDTGTLFLHGANTAVVGKTIPASANIVGVVHQRNDIIGAGQTKYKIAVRNLGDLGLDPADGSGTAYISPTSQPVGATSVTQTIVLKGDGTNTIGGMTVTIPSTWTWTGNSAHAVATGPGFASASKTITGDGSVGNPWIITLSGTAVTLLDSGIVAISNLTAPSASGNTTFIVRTRGEFGTLSTIAVQPTVNIFIVTALPFVENFEYATGSLLTANGWTAHSGAGTNPIAVNADPLTYPNYVHSGVGKSVTLTTTGEDVNRSFSTINAGSVYASFMVRVDTALIGGEYFFHLSPAGSPTSHIARVYFKKDASNNVAFGVSKGSATAEYTGFNYVFGTTYLIVLKYTFNTGSTTDDEIKLWINPALTGIEPDADLTTTPATTDPTSIGVVALRQGAGNARPALVLGGLRINTAWLPSGAATYEIPVAAGWNMVSVPLTVPDYRKAILFPTAQSSAFSYDGGYKTKDTLENAVGYWLKFPPSQPPIQMSGLARTSDSITVNAGWNMIGSLTAPFLINKITPSAGVTVTSPYYGYNAGYQIADTIKPGKAYWVKVNASGKLYFNIAVALGKEVSEAAYNLDELNSITITDAVGSAQTLYFGSKNIANFPADYFELPPQSPVGIFDARFKSQRSVELHPAIIEKTELFPVTISSAAYPITISWNMKNANAAVYELSGINGNAVTLSGSGSVKISDENVKSIQISAGNKELLPQEFSLGQNYPNPFNPSTRFNVALPQNAEVNVDVYDLLGRKLSSIVSGNLVAGNHSFEWNGKADAGYTVPSGIYFIKMTAKSTENKIFNFVRKATILK